MREYDLDCEADRSVGPANTKLAAILLQADEVLVKPFDVKALAQLIRNKLQEGNRAPRLPKESVAFILERDTATTIQLPQFGAGSQLQSRIVLCQPRGNLPKHI